MNELEAAQQIRDGLLPSPLQFGGMTLFNLRVTGTGASYRAGIEEHVWRSPDHYLNDQFLSRTYGLPVIWEHPEKSSLNSEEFADRVIGTVMLPFIREDEVWAVCRIYDDTAIKAMTEGQLSTSPAVVFKPSDGNTTIELEDGKTMLIEGIPSYLDHLAVCQLGVWDKNGPALGVQNDTITEPSTTEGPIGMTDEEKAAAEKAREDAARRDAGGDMKAMFDAMNKRMDAMEEDRKADRRRDAQSRRDAEREPWMKSDAATCAKDDAEEETEREKHKADGMDEDTAADKARKDRRDRMDARRKDAESEEEKEKKAETEAKERDDKARKDADEKAEKERADAIKADSQSSAALAAVMATMPKSPNDADMAVFADAQATYDTTYQAFGGRAPVPLQGEQIIGYRRRLARGLQSHSPAWKAINLSEITDSAMLNIAETHIRADAIVASRSSSDIPDGVLIPVTRTTDSGHRITEFRGRQTFISALKRPSLRATAFLTARAGS